ncbi:MAG: hypothetical protein IAE95_12760 [Chitinophagaceae bacterium]|nr:hypothetical protein [Chitinophagaceae bacterium]
MKRLQFVLIIMVFSFVACRKDTTPPLASSGEIRVAVGHLVEGTPLLPDSLRWQNQAGETYGVERLQYYLSNFRFYSNGKLVHTNNSIKYIDAFIDSTRAFTIPLAGAITGRCDSVSFLLGLDTVTNVSFSLPPTLQNSDMGWPNNMGGGYHFIKMEGHWRDGSALNGFALHVGRNGYAIPMGCRCSMDLTNATIRLLPLSMNVNEWFRTPAIYSLSTDGSNSMNNMTLMRKLCNNATDAFSAM